MGPSWFIQIRKDLLHLIFKTHIFTRAELFEWSFLYRPLVLISLFWRSPSAAETAAIRPSGVFYVSFATVCYISAFSYISYERVPGRVFSLFCAFSSLPISLEKSASYIKVYIVCNVINFHWCGCGANKYLPWPRSPQRVASHAMNDKTLKCITMMSREITTCAGGTLCEKYGNNIAPGSACELCDRGRKVFYFCFAAASLDGPHPRREYEVLVLAKTTRDTIQVWSDPPPII